MEYTIVPDRFDDAKIVRTDVYLRELGFRIEFDSIDDNELMNHIVLYVDDKPVGVVRVFPVEIEHKMQNFPDAWVFGRLAVLKDYRNNGLGSALIEYAEDFARERGAKEMIIQVQQKLIPFFEERGYTVFGPQKYDEHMLHSWMKKALD